MRLLREWWLTTAVSLALLALLVFGDLARPVGNVLYDQLMRWQGFRTTQDVVIVAIDDRSVLALGGWPLQRVEYAKSVQKASALANAFEFLFEEIEPHHKTLFSVMAPHLVNLQLKANRPDDALVTANNYVQKSPGPGSA